MNKILHLFGGFRALKIGNWQRNNGWEVHQIIMEDPKDYENQWKGKIIIHHGNFLTKVYKKVKSKKIFKIFKSHFILYPFYIPKLSKIINKEKIEIIHAHRHTGAFMAFLTKKIFNLKNLKIIFDYQDPWSIEEVKKKSLIQRFLLKKYYNLEGYLIKNSSLIVTQGEEQTSLLVKRHHTKREKFIFTWNTADKNFFKPYPKEKRKIREKYNMGNGRIILYLGSIINYFGVHLLPMAIKEITKNFPNVKFAIMGIVRDDKYWTSIKKYIEISELKKYFININPDMKDIAKIISSCDIGIISHMKGSMICEIAISTKLFEYMSCGLPVISSSLPHITQFLFPTKSGLEFKANNPKSLARVLNKLLKNPSKIRNMGKNSRRAVEKKYNWDTEMRKLMSAYKKVYDTQTKNI